MSPGEEGLPEWEPLTPELVEDEAIRGDFVIRWTVVGLALLMGMSQIAETRTLVHLKSGQYLIGHGFLPGRNDVLSHTATDRKWVNLPWLFDIMMAGVHSLGGGIGLSIVQGLLAGLAFGLLAHTVRPNIRTWWGSICAVLALLTCYLQFTIQPELVTLLGISFVLWTLTQSEEPGQSKRLWSLVPVIWVWAQLDQRAWFGWFLLLLWAMGESISRDSTHDGGTTESIMEGDARVAGSDGCASIFVGIVAGPRPNVFDGLPGDARKRIRSRMCLSRASTRSGENSSGRRSVIGRLPHWCWLARRL